MPTHYFVHVSKDSARNYQRGIERLTWGWKDAALDRMNRAYGGVRNRDLAVRIAVGDTLILAHRGPDPRGLRPELYADGTFRETSVFIVRRPLYSSTIPVWDDDVYPNRVDLEYVERGEGWGRSQLGVEGMTALQRSANAHGVPLPGASRLVPLQSRALEEAIPDLLDSAQAFDAYTWAIRRREQSRLRAEKLRQREVAPCEICRRSFPSYLLRAAHIKRRANCNPAERADLANVLLACVLGCDALFEVGHIAIDARGKICALRPLTDALRAVVEPLVGVSVSDNPRVLAYAGSHRSFHSL